MTRPVHDNECVNAIGRFRNLPYNCGELDSPGVDETEEWRDFSARESTDDQLRIEDIIARTAMAAGGNLLHIGIGNSGLAERLHPKFARIAGITIQPGELNRAVLLRIPNYEVRNYNKYKAGLAALFAGKFDIIVDNNPTSFCCCCMHLNMMMRSYAEMLKDGGVILSDRAGLKWVTPQNNKGWKIKIPEWFLIGKSFGFEGIAFSENVVGLMLAPG